MNLATLTPTELDTLRIEILTEQERRASLLAIPATVAILAAQYVAAGGERSTLDAAIAPA